MSFVFLLECLTLSRSLWFSLFLASKICRTIGMKLHRRSRKREIVMSKSVVEYMHKRRYSFFCFCRMIRSISSYCITLALLFESSFECCNTGHALILSSRLQIFQTKKWMMSFILRFLSHVYVSPKSVSQTFFT
jgi:hypothetical protein